MRDEAARECMVKQYLHVKASRSRHETLLGVAQHKFNLFSGHPWEPLKEFINPGAIFEIFEQCPHRHAAVLK